MGIYEDIRNKTLKPCYLFYGEESYLLNKAVAALKEIFGGEDNNFSIDIFDAESCTLADAVQAVSTVSFFSSQKLVIVKNTPWFSPAKRKSKGDEDAEEGKSKIGGQDDFLQYLANPLPDCCILFCADGAPDKRLVLFKAVQKYGGVETFEQFKKDRLIVWLRDYFNQKGITARQDLLDNMAAACSGSLEMLEHEAEKVLLFTDKKIIGLADCKDILSPSTELSVFELTYAVSQKQGVKALALYEEMLARGEASQKIAALLIKQFHQLLATADMLKQGFGTQSIKQELDLKFDFMATKLCRNSQLFTTGELMRNIDALLTADFNSKTGNGNMDDALKDILLKISI